MKPSLSVDVVDGGLRDKLLRHSLTKKRAVHELSSIESRLWLKALVGFHSLFPPVAIMNHLKRKTWCVSVR